MKNLLNHTELALSIENNNLENANTMYINKINMILSLSNNPNELKKLLYSINIFVYTYFCNKSTISLEDLCYKNLQLMDKYHRTDELITLGKEIIESYIKIINEDKTKSENETINQALEYIHTNIEKKITLEKVATHIHLSSNYLCYLFKEKTGFRFCEYINICRINAAKGFLDNSSYPLEIISSRSGFNSQSHFSTTFKKYVNVSPNEYRKRII